MNSIDALRYPDALRPRPQAALVSPTAASSSAPAPGSTRAGSATSTPGRGTRRAASSPKRSSRRRAWRSTPRRSRSWAATSASTSSRRDAFWAKLFASAPAGLRFGFKVPEEVTCAKWPTHARYGAARGMENQNFLDAEVFTRLFHEPLQPFDRTACYIFEFGTLPKSAVRQRRRLRRAAGHVPRRSAGGRRYSVEIRNPEYLAPGVLRHAARRTASPTSSTPGRGCRSSQRQIAMEDAYTRRSR